MFLIYLKILWLTIKYLRIFLVNFIFFFFKIDEQALLAYLGMKVDPDADAVQKKRY